MTEPNESTDSSPVIAAFATLDQAESLIAWTSVLARQLDRPVLLAYILDPGAARDPETVRAAVAKDMLKLLATDRRLVGLVVTTAVEFGLMQEELPPLASSHPGALLLMAASDRGAAVPAVLSSGGPSSPAARLQTSFAIVPANCPPPPTITQVVIGTDKSELSESILVRARTLAEGLAVRITTVEAIEPSSASVPEFLATMPVLGETHLVLRGRAGATVLTAARALGADMIIVGSTGRGRMTRMLLGSTAEWLARHSDRPVLFVPRIP